MEGRSEVLSQCELEFPRQYIQTDKVVICNNAVTALPTVYTKKLDVGT